jgi:NAD(P)H-dependent flavin oxidoreductase YrpB (nitropropane dioxygenase family)
MRTRVTELLGIEHPIISAGMGPDITGPELVAAVSNARAFGLLQAQLAPPAVFREEIRRVRDLTDKPFGVNLLLHFPVQEHLAVCLEEKVTALSFFWGDPSPYIDPAHDAGVLVMHQVGSVDDARRSAAAGVDVVIAQGVEAGGHVAGEISTLVLVPLVVDAISPTPVAAAGGIADARGVAAALTLGAQAAVLGTRFLMTTESRAHPEYKQRLIGAAASDTVRTTLFGHGWPNAPHRTLRTAFVNEWLGKEQRGQESRPDEPVVGHTVIAGQKMPVQRFMGIPPNSESTGDIALRNLLAGQAVGLIHEVKSAKDVVLELVAGTQRILERNAAFSTIETQSSHQQ